MIEILPENLANHVEKKCGSLAGELIPRPPYQLAIVRGIISKYLSPNLMLSGTSCCLSPQEPLISSTLSARYSFHLTYILFHH